MTILESIKKLIAAIGNTASYTSTHTDKYGRVTESFGGSDSTLLQEDAERILSDRNSKIIITDKAITVKNKEEKLKIRRK